MTVDDRFDDRVFPLTALAGAQAQTVKMLCDGPKLFSGAAVCIVSSGRLGVGCGGNCTSILGRTFGHGILPVVAAAKTI